MASVKQFQVTFDWDELNRSLPPERQDSAFACVDPTGSA